MRFIISFSLSVKQKIANFEPLKVHEDHIFELWHRQPVNCIRRDQNSTYFKSPYRPDAIWQGDANFQFSMTFNFNILLCFSNIRNHLSNFSYLVCISCKNFIGWRFYLFLKTENSRRVAESRTVCYVCMDLIKVWFHECFFSAKCETFCTKWNRACAVKIN
jgi:hypothetical protein